MLGSQARLIKSESLGTGPMNPQFQSSPDDSSEIRSIAVDNAFLKPQVLYCIMAINQGVAYRKKSSCSSPVQFFSVSCSWSPQIYIFNKLPHDSYSQRNLGCTTLIKDTFMTNVVTLIPIESLYTYLYVQGPCFPLPGQTANSKNKVFFCLFHWCSLSAQKGVGTQQVF